MEGKENQGNIESWDDFLGSWLKADSLVTVPAEIVVIAVRAEENRDGQPQVVLEINYNHKKYDFSLNKTNSAILRKFGLNSPKEAIGKVLVLNKTKVRDPNKKILVDSIFIEAIK